MGSMDWIDPAQTRHRGGCCIFGNDPSDSINCVEFLD